ACSGRLAAAAPARPAPKSVRALAAAGRNRQPRPGPGQGSRPRRWPVPAEASPARHHAPQQRGTSAAVTCRVAGLELALDAPNPRLSRRAQTVLVAPYARPVLSPSQCHRALAVPVEERGAAAPRRDLLVGGLCPGRVAGILQGPGAARGDTPVDGPQCGQAP